MCKYVQTFFIYVLLNAACQFRSLAPQDRFVTVSWKINLGCKNHGAIRIRFQQDYLGQQVNGPFNEMDGSEDMIADKIAIRDSDPSNRMVPQIGSTGLQFGKEPNTGTLVAAPSPRDTQYNAESKSIS